MVGSSLLCSEATQLLFLSDIGGDIDGSLLVSDDSNKFD